MKLRLLEGELAWLIRDYPVRRAVKVSFGGGSVWIDVEKDPQSAKAILDRREELAGTIVQDGCAI